MASIRFEGRSVPIQDGDTVAAALHRAGVQVMSRSFKYHRPRGLYCLSGDCANCLLRVDDEPAVRACVCAAEDGQTVSRENGWPSVDRDLLSVFWHIRALLPVGFYYKTFVKPRWIWPVAERVIRRVAGIGRVDPRTVPRDRERRHYHTDVCVLGGGLAGLAAALTCAERGERVVVVDEGAIGDKIAPGPGRAALSALHASVMESTGVTMLEYTSATGVYEGPLVTAAGREFVYMIHPGRIIVATGAVERHAVFPGSDVPGVWLARGAARMAGVHQIPPGTLAVVVVNTTEGLSHLETLRQSEMQIARVIAPGPLAARIRAGVPITRDGEVVAAQGWERLTSVDVRQGNMRETIACDTLVLALGFAPRDGLLRQAVHCTVHGAGDVVTPDLSVDAAISSGRSAALQSTVAPEPVPLPPAPTAGIVCTCEDVGADELAAAWREGFRSTELLKRYTTTTMGPCQGLLCHPHLRAFVRERAPGTPWAAPTTARPPARGMTVEDAAAGVRDTIEYRTALHDRHVASGARMEWAGPWKRAASYGGTDPTAEYWAVRKGVSIMDVSTLGKFLIRGPDAAELLDRICPSNIRALRTGKSRYTLYLNEAGYVFDDGMICAIGDGEYFATVTSSGAEGAEAWIRDWADTWRLDAYVVNQTTALGAINITGPRARELLSRLTNEPVDSSALPYSGLRRMTVAGVPCLTLRVGFTGELSYELHHPRSRSAELWDVVLERGADLGVIPHGLDTLKLLRLDKGHILIGQDTDFDTTPAKVGLTWVVSPGKQYFVGQAALDRLSKLPLLHRLVPIAFPGPVAPDEGAQLLVGSDRLGWVTSSRYSPALEQGVALGWLDAVDGTFATDVVAVSRHGRRTAGTVAAGPFYDPQGARLRA